MNLCAEHTFCITHYAIYLIDNLEKSIISVWWLYGTMNFARKIIYIKRFHNLQSEKISTNEFSRRMRKIHSAIHRANTSHKTQMIKSEKRIQHSNFRNKNLKKTLEKIIFHWFNIFGLTQDVKNEKNKSRWKSKDLINKQKWTELNRTELNSTRELTLVKRNLSFFSLSKSGFQIRFEERQFFLFRWKKPHSQKFHGTFIIWIIIQ